LLWEFVDVGPLQIAHESMLNTQLNSLYRHSLIGQTGQLDSAAFCVVCLKHFSFCLRLTLCTASPPKAMRSLHLLSTNAADLSSLNKRRVRATNIPWPTALTPSLASPQKRVEPPYSVHWPSVYRHFDAACGGDSRQFAVSGPYE
jgi:hypothetical protein